MGLKILFVRRHVKLEAGGGGGGRGGLEATFWNGEVHYRMLTVAHPSENICALFAIQDRA